jgi:hypothetical protein
MRFTFVVAGWPDSVYDMRMFNDALEKYSGRFPFSLEGIHVLYDFFCPSWVILHDFDTLIMFCREILSC